jgi:hypothetical protein
MLRALDFIFRVFDIVLRSPYRIIGPGYCEYWYREGKRKTDIHFEYLSPEGGVDMVVYASSIEHWLPPHQEETISETKRQEITGRFEQYLRKTGTRYRVQ